MAFRWRTSNMIYLYREIFALFFENFEGIFQAVIYLQKKKLSNEILIYLIRRLLLLFKCIT